MVRYSIGLPATVDVADDGTVTVTVHLADIDDLSDAEVVEGEPEWDDTLAHQVVLAHRAPRELSVTLRAGE